MRGFSYPNFAFLDESILTGKLSDSFSTVHNLGEGVAVASLATPVIGWFRLVQVQHNGGRLRADNT